MKVYEVVSAGFKHRVQLSDDDARRLGDAAKPVEEKAKAPANKAAPKPANKQAAKPADKQAAESDEDVL